jgi:sugar phosphate isomerase/epimerase
MISPGIWTGLFLASPLHEALERLALLGWRDFEIADEHLDVLMHSADLEADVMAVYEVSARYGLRTQQAHAHLDADVAHPDRETREREIAHLLRHFELASRLGALKVVVHPGKGGGCSPRDAFGKCLADNVESFKRLCERAGELGLKVGVENMYDLKSVPGSRRFGAMPFELLELIERVGAKNFGVTFDSSHASVQNLDLPSAIRTFGDKLLCTHISDNDGSGDQHRVPGSGRIPWAEVMGAFREIGYDGVLNLEVPGERHSDPRIQDLKVVNCLDVCSALCEGS